MDSVLFINNRAASMRTGLALNFPINPDFLLFSCAFMRRSMYLMPNVERRSLSRFFCGGIDCADGQKLSDLGQGPADFDQG